LRKKEQRLVKLFKNLCSHQRMAGDERRKQILGTAIKLFSKKGFRGTTTKEIARDAGISEAMVFRHFATKDELYTAILDHEACGEGEPLLPWEEDSVEKQAIAEKDDYQVFYNFALKAIEHHDNEVDFMRLLLYSKLENHELSEMFFKRFITPLYEFLGSYIRQRQTDGVFREIDPRMVVRSFLGMIIHHSLNNILWDKNRQIIDISNEEAAKYFTEILLNGIKK
jgi:AcrR family transcriptional regulator